MMFWISRSFRRISTWRWQVCDGEALTLVINTRDDDGLEAWRRITKRFDPVGPGRKRASLNKILSPGASKIHELMLHLETWKDHVQKYESRNKSKLQDDIKASVITEMCPPTLKDHIYLNSSRLSTYAEVLAEITAFAENKSAARDSDAMDVGYLGGKGGGKGGGGKGGGKSDRVCYNFGKKGHMAKECYSAPSGKGKSGDKGKGGKGEAKGAKGSAKGDQFDGYCSHCLRWGHRQAQCRGKAAGKTAVADSAGLTGMAAIRAKTGKASGKGKGLGALEQWPEEYWDETQPSGEPEQELGGMDLCALQRQFADSDFQQPAENNKKWWTYEGGGTWAHRRHRRQGQQNPRQQASTSARNRKRL